MGLSHSPKILTNGLVFAIDTGNDKSYKGPVMTNIPNLLTQIGTGTANGYSFTASTEDVFIPTVGQMIAKVNSGFNNYPAVSTNCCPGLFGYGSFNFNVSSSTLYTYAILYKTTSGYSHPNYMYRYEYNSGGTYLTEQGVHSTTNRIHLGDGWYWAWGTFTTQATTTQIVPYSYYYSYGTAIDKMYVAKIMIAQGDHTKLHPRYWPDVNTSRSNTQSVLDLTNRNSLISGNIAYSNNGTVIFSGANSRIDMSSSVPYGNNTTWEAWINRNTSLNTYNMFMGKYLPYFGAKSDGAVIFSNWLNSSQRTVLTSTGIIQNNTWYHLAFTTSYDGANTESKIYVNGIISSNGSFVGNQTDAGGAFAVGDGYNNYWYPYSGQVSNVKVYNRTLTATEILQNFNAIRGRYGL